FLDRSNDGQLHMLEPLVVRLLVGRLWVRVSETYGVTVTGNRARAPGVTRIQRLVLATSTNADGVWRQAHVLVAFCFRLTVLLLEHVPARTHVGVVLRVIFFVPRHGLKL